MRKTQEYPNSWLHGERLPVLLFFFEFGIKLHTRLSFSLSSSIMAGAVVLTQFTDHRGQLSMIVCGIVTVSPKAL